MRMKERTQGFTLLEMLVAIAIFAIVGAIAYTGLDRAIAIRRHLHTVRDAWEARGLAYFRLRNDLAQVRARPIRNSLGTLVPALVIRRTDGGAELSFTVGGPAPYGGTHRSNLARVDYVVRRGQLLWQRWQTLDRAPGSHRATLVLLTHVRRWRVRVLGQDGRYLKTWPPVGQPALLPRLVKITITLGNGRKLRWLLPIGR